MKVKAKANREYSLYDFYDDRTKTARADAAGNLSLPMTHSVEIFYFGERADSAFQKTLQSVRVTRGKLQLFEPEAPAPDAVPLAAALQGAPSGAEFLTFRGAMSAVARGQKRRHDRPLSNIAKPIPAPGKRWGSVTSTASTKTTRRFTLCR